MSKFPFEISAYISEHFRDGCQTDIQSRRSKSGPPQYKVKVYEDQIIHLLDFNEKGALVKHREIPAYEEDYYDGMFYGNEG